MATGLYSGVSGLAIGVGLNKGVTGLWSGASGLIAGWGGGFNPLTLFASGEQGAWYDPSDLTTMFQDTAGTTPVTATGQTVGLLLDKSQGLVLGPELVTNGDFSGGSTGWTLGSGWSVTGGVLSFDGSAVFSNVSQAMSLVQGRTYLITFTSTGTISALRMGGPTAGSNVATNITGSGAKTFRVTCVGTDGTLYIVSQVSSVATIDNISVKELPGNHATQATAASRPIYGIEPAGGRRNLLTYTEQFDNAVWVLQAAGVGVAPTRTLNAGTSPAGVTACRLQFSLGGGTTTTDQSIFRQSTTVPAGAGVFSVWLRSTDGVSSYVMQLTDPSGSGQNITVTGSWQRFQVTGTSAGTAVNYQLRLRGGQSPANSNTADVLFSEPQVETGSTATAYQRVTDQWNVTQAGVPSVFYIQCDGTDDFLLTGTITPGIDKAQVFAGVRKLSDAAVGVVAEAGVGVGASGELGMFAAFPANGYTMRSRGTITADAASPTTYTSPITNVLTGIGDIAGDRSTLRINGTQAAQSTADQGTGNYLAYPLYIGRRGGTSLPYNGRIYQMIVRFGANLSAATITQTESYTAGKTGFFAPQITGVPTIV